jgi:hypothetical protein
VGRHALKVGSRMAFASIPEFSGRSQSVITRVALREDHDETPTVRLPYDRTSALGVL